MVRIPGSLQRRMIVSNEDDSRYFKEWRAKAPVRATGKVLDQNYLLSKIRKTQRLRLLFLPP